MSGDKPGVEPGVLYVVATPIGHLEDITLRALNVLRNVDVIAAEDTRTTKKLLAHYQIKPPKLLALHEHNEREKIAQILKLLKQGATVALVSEAGTPGISDPGALLVAQIHKAGGKVCPIPGPSAVAAALSCAGFDLKKGFFFVGFLPAKRGERRRRLQELSKVAVPLVFFEAPHRLQAMLAEALEILGNREVFLAREMTKLHEEYRLTDLATLQSLYQDTPPRGEFCLVVAGAPKEKKSNEKEIKTLLKEALAQGISTRQATQEVSKALGIPRSQVYQIALQIKKGS